MTSQEEARLREILTQIGDNVRRRRLMMYPYFKDYDRVGSFTSSFMDGSLMQIRITFELHQASVPVGAFCITFELY